MRIKFLIAICVCFVLLSAVWTPVVKACCDPPCNDCQDCVDGVCVKKPSVDCDEDSDCGDPTLECLDLLCMCACKTQYICEGDCCEVNQYCCGGECCNSTQSCCELNTNCCDDCCNDICCSTAETCCNDECCNNYSGICCDDTECCDWTIGEVCCNGDCCNAKCCNSWDCEDCVSGSCETCLEKASDYEELTECSGTIVDDPDTSPSTNGCSSPLGNNPAYAACGASSSFLGACDAHDTCYGTCGSIRITECDAQFSSALAAVCAPFSGDCEDSCDYWAETYAGAVIIWGESAWENAQVDACACCNCD